MPKTPRLPPEDQRTDAELIAQRDLDALVSRYDWRLRCFVAGRAVHRSDIEDLCQEIWIKVFRNLHAYRHENFPGWPSSIAAHLLLDVQRKKKPGQLVGEDQLAGTSERRWRN